MRVNIQMYESISFHIISLLLFLCKETKDLVAEVKEKNAN